MNPITVIRSRTVVMPSTNIDTDQIIPARFLTTTIKEGLGASLFADWRYDAEGNAKPDFILNRLEAAGCRVLVAGRNIGCGSSREHAVWAIMDFGFKAVVSSRFADIFRNNSTKNGLVPVQVPDEVADALLRAVEADPSLEITIDVSERTVSAPAAGIHSAFELDDATRERFLLGLDDIGLTLEHADAIDTFEANRPAWMPSIPR